MAKPKIDIHALAAEEAAREAEEKKALESSVPAPKTDKKKVGRGRPVTRPESKLVSYNLPLELIERIDKEAARVCGRNKSALVEKAFEVYFASM